MSERRSIGIIGLGYVGLPLAQQFVRKGHRVHGIDIDQHKVGLLQKGKSYLTDIRNHEVKEMLESGVFSVSTTFEHVFELEVVILCVPTPLGPQAEPDLSYVKGAVRNIIPYLKKGQMVILESSTYPGTTEEELLPMLESTGMRVGQDIALVYSPERIDPGQTAVELHKIPKVLGGVTPACAKRGEALYRTVFEEVVVVSSPRAAEMTKIVENCQRLVNISFMNELAMLCDHLKIDIWEVVSAASTKPYGFVPYYPGPGVGGHCIPVDPLYLLWKARDLKQDLKFIDVSHQINEAMPEFVVQKVQRSLAKPLADSKILVLGVTYKKDVNDIRESRALTIMQKLIDLGADVSFYDPYFYTIQLSGQVLKRVSLTPNNLRRHDCTLILTDHSAVNYEMVVTSSPLVVDTRNATDGLGALGNVILM